MKFFTRKLIIDIDDSLMSYIPKELQRRIENEKWESQEISMIKHIPADSTVLDLGGCIGIFSSLLNRNLYNKNNHVVLEANNDLIPILEQVKKDNDCGYNVLNAMLAMTNGEQIFYKHPTYALAGCLKKHAEFYIECQIKQYTLTDLEIKYNMHFDVICMDIEGGEYALYQDGFFSNSNMKNIKYLMLEMHNDKFAPSHVKGKHLAKVLHNHLSGKNMFTLKHRNNTTYLYERI